MKTIVLVDDNPVNLKVVITALRNFYRVVPFTSGYDLISYLQDNKTPDLILLDVDMPDLSGFQTLQMVNEGHRDFQTPVIFLTGRIDPESEMEGLDLGAVDYIAKPINHVLLRKRVEMHLSLFDYRHNLEELVEQKTRTINKLTEVSTFSIAAIVETKDAETGGHINRTSRFVDVLTKNLLRRNVFPEQINEVTLEMIRLSAPLHDLGKVGIPDSILCKPGPLSPEEFNEMKKHTTIGANALAEGRRRMGEFSFLDVAELMARYHHEKWDGSGYPEGLIGEEIPVYARIMAIADVYDALRSKRPYKPALSSEEAYNIIYNGSGKHFDPALIEIFQDVYPVFEAIADEFKD